MNYVYRNVLWLSLAKEKSDDEKPNRYGRKKKADEDEKCTTSTHDFLIIWDRTQMARNTVRKILSDFFSKFLKEAISLRKFS